MGCAKPRCVKLEAGNAETAQLAEEEVDLKLQGSQPRGRAASGSLGDRRKEGQPQGKNHRIW